MEGEGRALIGGERGPSGGAAERFWREVWATRMCGISEFGQRFFWPFEEPHRWMADGELGRGVARYRAFPKPVAQVQGLVRAQHEHGIWRVSP